MHVFKEGETSLAERSNHIHWVSRINRALSNHSFQLYYQSIVDVAGELSMDTHYELLLRMRDDDGSIIPPGAFLPAAELYNLAPKLDRWVIENALDWLQRHPEHVQRLRTCAINLSGHSLACEWFADFVVAEIDNSGVPFSKICLEITETAAIADLDAAGHFIKTLRDRSCTFALDDFGSGLSSFAYLKNLPVDYLKIDGMFVKDIIEDPSLEAMVRAMNDVGQVMGKKTVAEFVENKSILARLHDIGVDYAQGLRNCPAPQHGGTRRTDSTRARDLPGIFAVAAAFRQFERTRSGYPLMPWCQLNTYAETCDNFDLMGEYCRGYRPSSQGLRQPSLVHRTGKKLSSIWSLPARL